MSEGEGLNPQEQLYRLLAGKWVTAAISAAAEIGLADELAAGPRSLVDLASALGCDAEALQRLLRVLGGEGLIDLDRDGRFELTAVGQELRQGQLREVARFVGLPFMWAPWSSLGPVLSSNSSAFEAAMGAPLFEYLDSHPKAAQIYHQAVDAFTRREARALAEIFDFSSIQSIVDVGGGLGSLLAEVGKSWPNLERCVLFDRQQVIEQAKANSAARELGARMEFVAGDFLHEIPVEADVFVVKHVLHNWQDDDAIAILKNCVRHLRPGGYVLIVEGILLPGLQRDRTALLDLEMFVLCGRGRERTKPEFRTLLRDAGLSLRSTHDLAGTTRLLVATPR